MANDGELGPDKEAALRMVAATGRLKGLRLPAPAQPPAATPLFTSAATRGGPVVTAAVTFPRNLSLPNTGLIVWGDSIARAGIIGKRQSRQIIRLGSTK